RPTLDGEKRVKLVMWLPAAVVAWLRENLRAGNRSEFITRAIEARITEERESAERHAMKRISLVPAYGRDYKSKKAVEVDLRNGKDFTIADFSCPDDGRYANLQDLEGAYDQVNIRYAKLSKVAVITL
ncbi:unnamed protein product, partial [marine sediment metagenome]